MEIHQDTIHEKKYKTFRKRFDKIKRAKTIKEIDIKWLSRCLREVLPKSSDFKVEHPFGSPPSPKWGRYAGKVMDDIENLSEKKITKDQAKKGFDWIRKNRRKFVENWVSRDGLWVSERLKDEDFEDPIGFDFVGFSKYYGGIYNIFSEDPIYRANYASRSIEYTVNPHDKKNPVRVHQVYADK